MKCGIFYIYYASAPCAYKMPMGKVRKLVFYYSGHFHSFKESDSLEIGENSVYAFLLHRRQLRTNPLKDLVNAKVHSAVVK